MKKLKNVLLINPPSSFRAYSKSKIKEAIPKVPILNLAALAASLMKNGHNVEILNLPMSKNPQKDLEEKLVSFRPTYVGITFTTPLVYEVKNINNAIKSYDSKIKTIGGGPHASAMPEESLADTGLDIVVIGEGDNTLTDIVDGKELSSVNGISFKKNGNIFRAPPRNLIENLDSLPFPAWELYKIKEYKTARLTSKKNPVGAIETSRGCKFGCVYCNKSIFGRKFRYKSARRVVDEIIHMLDIGFQEIHVWDDMFTTDIVRAKEVCDLIKKEGLDFPWNLQSGVRVNSVDKEFFEKAYDAGCYSVSFGIESGNQNILNNIKKGITIEQARRAVKMAKEVGLETLTFFMLGLPGDTEETMRMTIDFAKELDTDYAKATIALPFPSTPLFNQLEHEGRIKTRDWSKYNFHTLSEVYEHPNLDWETLNYYYDLFYREFYFRKGYILNRIKKGLLNGNIFYDTYYFLNTWVTPHLKL